MIVELRLLSVNRNSPADARPVVNGHLNRDFPVDQCLLAFDAPAIARHRSTVAHDAMTGDCQGDRVLSAGLSDRSQRFGAAHTAGELRVGEGFSERNRAKRIPNTALEWRAANVEVKVERIARRSDELHNLGQVIAGPAGLHV